MITNIKYNRPESTKLKCSLPAQGYLLLVGLFVFGLFWAPPAAYGQDYPHPLVNEFTSQPKEPLPEWAIGPFSKGKVNGQTMFFQQDWDWKGPTVNKDWKVNALWNPSLIAADGRLYLFYRAGPQMEGLQSRIGLAWSDDGGGTWHDYEDNPIIHQTEEWEKQGTEDPKVYKYDGTYYLFYNGVEKKNGHLYVDVALATSTDLRHWKKHGRIMPRSFSKGWAKGAVIPDTPEGVPVKIKGKFIMYISQRGAGGYAGDSNSGLTTFKDDEEQMIGYSTDLIHWSFKHTPYLLPSENKKIKSIREVATATTNFPDSSDNIVLDVFYNTPEGHSRCGQALYSKKNPTKQLDFTPYGTCSWGGIIAYRGQWVFPQGWGWHDPGAVQLYTAPMHQ